MPATGPEEVEIVDYHSAEFWTVLLGDRVHRR